MPRERRKMKKFIQLMQMTTLGRFLLPAGIIILIFGIVSFGNIKDARSFIETQAVISKTELYQEEYTEKGEHHPAEYNVFVKYTVNGKEYESELGILSGVKEGDSMKVYYNPKDPGEVVQMKNQAVIPYVALGVGALAIIGGVLSVVKAVQKMKRMEEQEAEWR
jgi:hypothetical protein